METTVAGFIVFVICLIGCASTSWHLGRSVGIKGTVNYLVERGLLEVDDDVPR
jgi:hypothetical protein